MTKRKNCRNTSKKEEKIYLHWEIDRRHYETTKGVFFTTYSDMRPGVTRYTNISLQ